MKPKVQNLIFDLDGTLLSWGHEPLPQTVTFLKELQKQGFKITFATGRSHILIRNTTQFIQPDLPVISSNGALIYDFAREKALHMTQLAPQSVVPIMRLLLQLEESFCIYTDKKVFGFEKPGIPCKRLRTTQSKIVEPDITQNNFTINPLTDASKFDFATQNITKILLITEDRGRISKIIKHLDAIENISYVSSMTFALDIMHKDVNKAYGLKALEQQTGLDPQMTMVFGDGDNDVEIFNAVKYSVAMANGSDLAKQNATFISEFDNDHDGIYHFLQCFLKIE